MLKEDAFYEVREDSQLMMFLLQNLKKKSRDNIKSLLKNKQVCVNDKIISQFNHVLKPGDKITIRSRKLTDLPPEKYLKIVYEDEDLIVIEKQSGLLSVTDGTDHITASAILSQWVRQENPEDKIFVVHRLDQYTSGLMMFARNEKVQRLLRDNWKTYVTERTYAAVVEGILRKPEGTFSSYLAENKALVMRSVKDPSQGKLAITHYKTIRHNNDYSLLSINLETGKKNQIRVHMNDMGHSIAGDRKYGAKTDPIGRLCLHAHVLAFKHPVSGNMYRFESNIPAPFQNLLK